MPIFFLVLFALMFSPYLSAQDATLIAKAKAIHDRVLTLDTHVDINPDNFTAAQSYATKLKTQVNIPSMEEGGLDAVFLIVYVGQSPDFSAAAFSKATASAMEKFDAIDRLVNELAPGRVELARSAADVRRIYASGKKVILIGVENGYQLGDDLANVRRFAERGARYLSLAHNGHSQLSDSNTGERDGVWAHQGLSPLGRQVIAELNKWGVMVDISHPSKQSMMQTLEITKAPIIASHSGVRAICNHSRNLDDEQLKGLAKNGGVVQVVAFNGYVKCQQDSPDRQRATEILRARYGTSGRGGAAALPDSVRGSFLRDLDELNRRFPAPPRATVRDFVDHIDYAVKLIGLDHVGISSDFDGGGGVEGWNNATETINVTIELVRRGYTEEQIGKLWGGNLLRVLDQVEKTGKRLRGEAS